MEKLYTYVDLRVHPHMFKSDDFNSTEDFFDYIFAREKHTLNEVTDEDITEGFIRQYEDRVQPWTPGLEEVFVRSLKNYRSRMNVYCEIPAEVKADLKEDGIEAIFDFFSSEAGIDPEDIKADMFTGWRRFRTIDDCICELGLTDCTTWADVTEYYPMLGPLRNGDILVAID